VYNPVTIFVLGAACGALMVLFALLAWWVHTKDAAQSTYQQYRSHFAYSKGMVWAGMVSASCAIIAVVGAVDSTFALPHLEWPAGVLTGVGVPLGLVYMRWRAQATHKPRHSYRHSRG
jgi:hypothetical protein